MLSCMKQLRLSVAMLATVLSLSGLSGCAEDELPPALPVAAALPPPKPELSDSVRSVVFKFFADEAGSSEVTSVKVKQVFHARATVTVDDSVLAPEVRGQLKCLSVRPGRTVTLDATPWIGKRTGKNEYMGTAKLRFPVRGVTSVVGLSMGATRVGQVELEVIE